MADPGFESASVSQKFIFVMNSLKCLPKEGVFHRTPEVRVIKRSLGVSLSTSVILYTREWR